jgi:hypothetical protein
MKASLANLARRGARMLSGAMFLAGMAAAGCGASDESGPTPKGHGGDVQDVGYGRVPIPPAEVVRSLPPDGGPDWNRLVFEQSPYLLQHAANPVDWYPWGEEAFERARREDKPVFLSVGYSTCHWCHVMEHESFEDAEVAALMNANFVSIKVDREERPDVDQVYMTVTQAMTGGGGWPMTVVLTPDRVPFFAGTYFPKRGAYGRPGMMELLPRIAAAWRNERESLLGSADQVLSHLRQGRGAGSGDLPGERVLGRAYEDLLRRFDNEEGGFGTAPKFPVPHNLRFLVRYAERSGEERALTMVRKTLDAMRRGGIWDHVGFGFHRYSTDRRWLVPHFEKMLYDQALLALAYLEAYQITGDSAYAETARGIFTYVLRDMTSGEGAFYSAEDADSEGEEGKFYLWRPGETLAILGPDEGALFNRIYGISESGNFRDPHTGKQASIPHLARPLASWAAELRVEEAELAARLEASRKKLLAARAKRIHPLRDDKVLTDWNGLMVAAFAVGAQVVEDARYAEAARRAADFMLEKLRDTDGNLFKRWRRGEAGLDATLEDHAFFAWGLLELYEATFEPRYLAEARALAHAMIERFRDEKSGGGFFLSSAGRSDLLVRPKESYDGAIPSGNSVAAVVLVRLGRMTGDPALEKEAEGVLRAFASDLERAPSVQTQMLVALDFLAGPSFEVVVVGTPGAADTRAMISKLRRPFLPRKVVLLRAPGPEGAEISALAPYVAQQTAIEGMATAYVCQNFACQAPTTDPAVMLAALESGTPEAGSPAPR